MTEHAFRFIASAEMISAIKDLADQQKVQLSQSQPFDSTAEPLNAPITGAEIVLAAQMVSAIFAAGSVALTFIDKLIEIVRRTKQPIEIRRLEDNRRIVIRPETDESSIKNIFTDV